MGVRLISSRGPGTWDMRCDEVYAELGLDPNKHLPAGGIPATSVQGVPVFVTPHVPNPNGRKSSKHRVFAICTCGRSVPVGRLGQHKCKGT